MFSLLRLVVAALVEEAASFSYMASFQTEFVDSSEHIALLVRVGVLALRVCNASATHRAPTTYGFAGARCLFAYSSGSRYGLDALAGAPLASHPPEATRPKAIAYERPRRCCRWAA